MRKLKNIKMYIYTIILLIFYITLKFYLGSLKFGFSVNPYSHKPIIILKNIIIQGLPIILIEIARILVISKNRKNKIVLFFITVCMILLQINYVELYECFSVKEELFQYICGEIIPIVFYNIFFSYLVLNKVYFFGIFYRITEKLLNLICPIIPDLDWFSTGSIDILFIMITFFIFKYSLLKSNSKHLKKKNFFEKLKYLITLGFSISLVCFMLGIFKYQPISIMSNSMMPFYERGDTVVFKKLSKNELNKIENGKIIVYSSGQKNIAHRVINRIKKGDKVFYQTKGDNNDNPDTKLVEINQILGVYTLHIKFIGFPSIWLYEYFGLE